MKGSLIQIWLGKLWTRRCRSKEFRRVLQLPQHIVFEEVVVEFLMPTVIEGEPLGLTAMPGTVCLVPILFGTHRHKLLKVIVGIIEFVGHLAEEVAECDFWPAGPPVVKVPSMS